MNYSNQFLFKSIFGVFCIFIAMQLKGAVMVDVVPAEYTNALSNPLKGFRPSFQAYNHIDWKEYPYPTVVRHYIEWHDIENDESDTIEKIRDFCNTTWAGCEAANVKIVPRVILQYGDGTYYFPSDLPNGVWDSEELRSRVIRMIGRLGELWDNDPRVAWVQTGIIGKWGEQESPIGVDDPVVKPDNSTWASIMGNAFEAAFPNKLLVVRNQKHWTDEGYVNMGTYWDSFGHINQYSGAWRQTFEHNETGRYLVAPVEGEVAYDWGAGRDNFGYSPTETVSTPAYYGWIVDTAKQLHCSSLGWISGYAQDSTTAVGANALQKAFGYRFLINEFQCPSRVEPGDTLDLVAKITNVGSAPMYENWPVAFVLVDEESRQIVWQSTLSGVDITSWHPGSNYDWEPKNNPDGTRTYLTPAAANEINASLQLPVNIPPKKYLAGISILEPNSLTPGLFFAIENFFKESQAQPLCRIGVGVDVSDHTLESVSFDDPLTDDSRSYTLTTKGQTHWLSSFASNGTVDVSNGNYTANSSVTLTATPLTGYRFEGWSGDISSTKNPMTITMDADKFITAHFSAVSYDVLWQEKFSLSENTTSNTAPTSWNATRNGGTFHVNDSGRLQVNDAGEEGVFTSGEIDISGTEVVIGLFVWSQGGLEPKDDANEDYFKIYKQINGGPEQLIHEHYGTQTATNLSLGNITGNTLSFVIRTRVTASDESYYFDNLTVSTYSPSSAKPTIAIRHSDSPDTFSLSLQNMRTSFTYELQEATSLTSSWTTVSTTNNVMSVDWTITSDSADPSKFFRIIEQ